MKHKKTGLLLIAGLMSATGITYPVISSADNTLAIPASACQIFRDDHAAKVILQNGYWRFKDKSIGRAWLECPYPGGTGDTGFTTASIIYLDSDHTGTAAHVKARFQIRRRGFFSTTATFDSNSDPSGTNATTFQTQTIGAGAQTLAEHELGSFFVEMSRSNTTQLVAFSGFVVNATANVPALAP